MAKPTHTQNPEDTARTLCGFPITKKTRTSTPDETCTCVNCQRVLDGITRQGERKVEVAERMRDDRIAWTGKALAKAQRIAEGLKGSEDVVKAIGIAQAKLAKLSE